MIVGTAGHIDHGKTTLVRALTGVDTDRLKEEKERGISIDLGYAYAPLDSGDVLGYVDVPGHEKLVHTAVAGACGIDFALLVVAVDDGVMPQTREHLAILELLGISRGAVALSKIDRVGHERVLEVEADVRRLLSGTALDRAPIFKLDATAPHDPGMASLRRYLEDAASLMPARDEARLFRFAVDRVFTFTGHGTIVTGTVFSGRICNGDTAMLMPANTSVRVRGIHAQNRAADCGRAGQRCALNIAGVERSAVARGDWLADARAFVPTTRLDVRLRLLADAKRPLRSWSSVHVHLATTHRAAHVVLLDFDHLSPGESARVQLVFDAPVCATPGDRFILRDAQAAHTIGGGVILDPYAPSRKRRSAQRAQYLDTLERIVEGADLAALLEQTPYGVKMSDLMRLVGRDPQHIALPADVVSVEAGGEQFVLLGSHWHALRERTLIVLREFHASVPEEAGPDSARLRRIALPEVPQPIWRALIDEMARERIVMRNGPWLHLPQHVSVLSDGDQALARQLQPLMAAGRFDPPWVRELAAVVREPEQRVREVLLKQVRQGAVYQVVRDLFYDSECIRELARLLYTMIREHDGVNAARYRDAIGLGRKRTIQILEFFDRIGFTRRVGEVHVLRKDAAWERPDLAA